MNALPPDRLPVALRPYEDEALSSWLSRTAAVYGYNHFELLDEYLDFSPSLFNHMDFQPSMLALLAIQTLVGGSMEQLEACTLATVYPYWLPKWISCSPPLWHVTEHRTVKTNEIRPTVCRLCLTSDIKSGRSQYLRLSWLCSITTICPKHLCPLETCCAAFSLHTITHEQDWNECKRIGCLSCRNSFDPFYHYIEPRDMQPLLALAHLECELRYGLAGNRILDLKSQLMEWTNLLRFVEDMTWLLMLPVDRTPYRILHSVQIPQFPVPEGFNTPVMADNWLSCAPLHIRRAILALLASLILPTTLCGSLVSLFGRGRPFWAYIYRLLNAEQHHEFQRRVAFWSADVVKAVDFY